MHKPVTCRLRVVDFVQFTMHRRSSCNATTILAGLCCFMPGQHTPGQCWDAGTINLITLHGRPGCVTYALHCCPGMFQLDHSHASSNRRRVSLVTAKSPRREFRQQIGYYYYYYYYYFLNLGRSSRGGGQKLILEIIALMVSHPSGSHQQSSRAAG